MKGQGRTVDKNIYAVTFRFYLLTDYMYCYICARLGRLLPLRLSVRPGACERAKMALTCERPRSTCARDALPSAASRAALAASRAAASSRMSA